MSQRNLVLAGSLALIAFLGFLTISVVVRDGFTVLVGISFFLLVLLAVGVIGALGEPPDE